MNDASRNAALHTQRASVKLHCIHCSIPDYIALPKVTKTARARAHVWLPVGAPVLNITMHYHSADNALTPIHFDGLRNAHLLELCAKLIRNPPQQ